MRLDATYASPAQGLYQAQNMQFRSTSEIARHQPSEGDGALVDLKRAEQQAQTSTQALKSSDEMVGTLIDMMV